MSYAGKDNRTPHAFMQDQWQPGLFYHVIGKAVTGAQLFRDEKDERYFIRHVLRFKLYHFLEILVYCLCGNHFHVVARTRSVAATRASLRTKPPKSRNLSDELMLAGEIDFATYAYHTVAGATSGYARHFNHKYGREGRLFLRPTLHGLTDKGAPGELFSRRLGCYVGLNFVKHRMGRPGENYFGSSLTNPQAGIVDHPLLLSLYGGEEAYHRFHNAYLRRFGHEFYGMDEDGFYAALRPRYYDKATRAWVEGEWAPDVTPPLTPPTAPPDHPPTA